MNPVFIAASVFLGLLTIPMSIDGYTGVAGFSCLMSAWTLYLGMTNE